MTSIIPYGKEEGTINYNTGEKEDGGLGESDGRSDEIVRALEKGLSKWKGLEDIGWIDEVRPRDRTRYQELQGYRVSLFVLYLWLDVDGELVEIR